MNPCPCLNKNEMPAFLIKAKQLTLETSVLANVVKECRTGQRDDLKCTVNADSCVQCVDRIILSKRTLFKLI